MGRIGQFLLGSLLVLALAAGCASPSEPGAATEAPTRVDDSSIKSAEALAVVELAQRLGVDPAAVTVLAVEAVQWPDTSLGFPEPGKSYAQVITPGYRIQLEVEGKVYELHGDSNGRFVMASDPDPAPRPAPHSRLHQLVDYWVANHPQWGLHQGMAWMLEDASAPDLGGSQAWVWQSGPWTVEISAPAAKGASFDATLVHADRGVAWRGTLLADGQIVPQEDPLGDSVEDAFRYLLDFFDKTYPGFGLAQQKEWLGRDVTPPGLLGSSTRMWNAGDWSLVLSFALVPEPGYSVLLTHSKAGTVWSGELQSDGQVVSEQPVLLSVQTGPCDQSMQPDELEGWAGVEFRVQDGLIYMAQRLSYVCCAELALAAGRDGSVLKVVETNVGEICRCMCGYTVEAELNGLLPGTYTVEVWGVQFVPTHTLELLGVGQVTVE
jgi:hypothetical protein